MPDVWVSRCRSVIGRLGGRVRTVPSASMPTSTSFLAISGRTSAAGASSESLPLLDHLHGRGAGDCLGHRGDPDHAVGPEAARRALEEHRPCRSRRRRSRRAPRPARPTRSASSGYPCSPDRAETTPAASPHRSVPARRCRAARPRRCRRARAPCRSPAAPARRAARCGRGGGIRCGPWRASADRPGA